MMTEKRIRAYLAEVVAQRDRIDKEIMAISEDPSFLHNESGREMKLAPLYAHRLPLGVRADTLRKVLNGR